MSLKHASDALADGWGDEDFFGSAEQDSEREPDEVEICAEEVQPEIRRRYREIALGAVGFTADLQRGERR